MLKQDTGLGSRVLFVFLGGLFGRLVLGARLCDWTAAG